jgi:hypothetical protein
MGVRTRGLDIKAGAAKLKADKAARLEAELVIDRWNRRLATGRDMLWSPTIRAALVAGTPWLDVFCPGCGTSRRSVNQAGCPRLGLLLPFGLVKPRHRAETDLHAGDVCDLVNNRPEGRHRWVAGVANANMRCERIGPVDLTHFQNEFRPAQQPQSSR